MNMTAASTTQSLDRALNLLDHVVIHAKTGISLADLAERAHLSKPTAHRLLTGLRQGGLVNYNSRTRLFSPAFKLYRMGLAAGARFDIVQLSAASMDRLAAETGDTIYLSVRSGDQATCGARRVGAFPIKTLTLEVGDARPLGLGAGSLALLALLPDAEVKSAIERNGAVLAQHPNFAPALMWDHVHSTRAAGYSLNDGQMMPEMAAIGMGIRDPQGAVVAALSIAGLRSRLQPPRRATLRDSLAREVAEIENAIVLRDKSG
jgi:DNA-binding IclR family transcriptional regulator